MSLAEQQFRGMVGLPEPEDLLSMSPEEAAGVLLKLISTQQPGAFVPADVVRGLSDRGYGRNFQADFVLMEGIAYLERYGLLIEDIHSYGGGRGRRLSRQGKEAAASQEAFSRFISGASDPRSLLHADIMAKALPIFDRGPDHFETAIFAAFKCVEVAVREAAALGDSHIGTDLMNDAFGAGRPLRDTSKVGGEQEGMRALFAGAIAIYKNPSSHRYVGVGDTVRALNALMIASELLFTLEDITERLKLKMTPME